MTHHRAEGVAGQHVPIPTLTGHDGSFPLPDTELGVLFASTDWSSTLLGPVDTWPLSLRNAVSLCLSSRFPMQVCWGPDLVMVYNDGYRELLGHSKHPRALGAPVREVWAEIWDVIGPMFDDVLTGAGATWSKDQLLLVDRYGYVEEAYFTFTYGPIPLEDGTVGGILNVATETTDAVLAERRARTKAAVVAAVAGVTDANEVLRRAIEAMRVNDNDHVAVDIVLKKPAAEVVADPRVHVVPVREPGLRTTTAYLVLTEHPHRPWDELLASYAALCAGHIGTALSGIRRLEEEQQRAEGLAQLDAAKSALLANVSHELRTPLTLISGPVEDALTDPAGLPTGQRERLEMIQRNALRLRTLVDQLLDVSRIEAGAVRPRHVEVDVVALVRGLTASFRPAIERVGLTFTQQCPALPRRAHLDPDMVERIVLNLLSNALKYTPEGTISLSLRAVEGGFEIAIADTGIGIPEESLDQVFERFRQVTGKDGRRSHEGAGIGLALARQLAELQGGRVSVESIHGRGSTFTVFLPWGEEGGPDDAGGIPSITQRSVESFVTEASGWHDRPEAQQSVGVRHSGEAKDDGDLLPILLLAEDNADMRRYVAQSLSDDYRVVSVRDGVEALERVHAARPDIVLADVMMPRLDGLGLVEALRADPGMRDIPVVLLSARAGVDASVDGLSQGADDYVVKPFNATELRARLASNLARARGRSRDGAWRRAVMAALREPLVIADRDGNVLEMNEAFTSTYGWSLADGPISPPYPWWVDPQEDREERDWAVLGLERLRSGLPSFDETFRLRRRNGSDAWVSVAASGVPEASDHPGFLLGTFRDETRERESRFRRSLAARLAVELAKAEDLEQVLASAVTGFSVLFDGQATVRVAGGRRDVVFTPDGLTTLDELTPEMRARMTGVVEDLVEPRPSAAAHRATGEHRRLTAPEPVPGLVLAPSGANAECRAWVQFHEPRVVPSDELVVGDLLALAFAQAVDRVAARQDRAEQDQHFQRAVESHRLIGHAVGILIERHKVTAAQGFEMLRQASLNRNIKLRELAVRVIETGMEPIDTV